MTRHSSSQLGKQTVLLDSLSRPVPIGAEFGRGGEGSVYEVAGEPALLAKIYHKPLLEEQTAKYQAMAACWSSALETIAAWPRAVLFNPSTRKPCGILMSKMVGARPLHELYGTTNRRRHFPEVGWHHLVLAARNTAAAFQTLHAANIVVGDVNQGNLLVDKNMTVRMIDCDSFQLTAGKRTFNCPVGTPHFTPPELQSQKLREVVRTANHDRFGLAVLIFHLLFVGRHPFAGRYRGPGDLPIEKAIAERRFAFSKRKSETLVDPPPASLLIEDLPPGVGELFERAFRSTNGSGSERPTPLQWVQELDALVKRRKACQFDSSHIYFAQLGECPWCRIEDSGGPTFFVPEGGTTIVSADRLAVLDERILELPESRFADLPSQRLALPHMPVLRKLKDPPKPGLPDWLGVLMGTAWAGCFAGAIIGGVTGGIVLAGFALVSIALAALMLKNKFAAARRKTKEDYDAWLEKSREVLATRARTIEHQFRLRETNFERSNEELQKAVYLFRHAEENIRDVIAQNRETQKADYLRGFLVRDHWRKIEGLNPSEVAMMESFGMETANEIDQLRLYGIPGLEPETVMELLQWKRDVEQGFRFNPEHGITLDNVGSGKELAVRRFKIGQARKILAGSKQLETMADVGKAELAAALSQFDAGVEQWTANAKQCRDFQSGRWRLERLINQSPIHVMAPALGGPFIAFVIYLLFRR
jgi:DNA-binding helix-hairpin-helix protein with protein kinase domain